MNGITINIEKPEEKKLIKEDVEISRENRVILSDKANGDRYELFIDTGKLRIMKLGDDE